MLTEKQIAAKIEEIRTIIQADIVPFENDSPEKKSKRKDRARDDVEYFYQQYLPDFFTSKSGKFHKEIDAKLEERKGDIIGFCGPREHAKTSRWVIGYELHEIVYRKRRFILNISETEDMAIIYNLLVRTHLESNVRLRNDFGDLINTGAWSEQEFITKNGVKILARGYKQPVRGLLFGPYRPDYMRIEDISSYKSARNEILEREKMDWILGECYGGLSQNGTLFWTGNILRKTSAIAQLEHESKKPGRDITYLRMPAILPNGKILWKERYTLEYFQQIKAKIGSRAFEREYQQNPVEDGVYYREEWFNKIKITEAASLWKTMDRRIMYIDPSYGNKKRTGRSRGSDKKVAVIMGKSKLGYFLFDAIAKQTTLEKFGAAVCEKQKEWNVPTIWYEGNFGQKDLIGKFLNEAASAKNMILPLKPFYNFADKDDRIEKGNPLAENGLLWYVEGNADTQEIIDNLCMYPDVEFDDPADAYSAGIEILERGPIKIKAKIWA